jgi:hypothetical protein
VATTGESLKAITMKELLILTTAWTKRYSEGQWTINLGYTAQIECNGPRMDMRSTWKQSANRGRWCVGKATGTAACGVALSHGTRSHELGPTPPTFQHRHDWGDRNGFVSSGPMAPHYG